MTQSRLFTIALVGLGLAASGTAAEQKPEGDQAKPKATSSASAKLDRSGKKQVGKADGSVKRGAGAK